MLFEYNAISDRCLSNRVVVNKVDEFSSIFVYPNDFDYDDFKLFESSGFDISKIDIQNVIDTIANIPSKLNHSNYDLVKVCISYKGNFYDVRLEELNETQGREATLQAALIVYSIMKDYFNRKSLDVNALFSFMLEAVYKNYGSQILGLFVKECEKEVVI